MMMMMMIVKLMGIMNIFMCVTVFNI